MDLELLRRFVAVAETLSFSTAAARLKISQPSISRSIALLEQEMGVPLLKRNQRSVTLTGPGKVLIEEAPRLIAHADMLKRVTQHATESNRLNLGLLTMALYRTVPNALREFKRRWPGVDLRITELSSVEQFQRLRDGTLDIGIVLLDSTIKHEMAMRIIERSRIQFVVPARSEWARKSTIALKELANAPFIVAGRSAAPWFRNLLELRCREAGFVPNIVHEMNQIFPSLKLVSSGLGVALVPENARVHPVSGVKYLSVKDSSWKEEALLAMVWVERTLPAVMKDFIHCMTEISSPRAPKPKGRRRHPGR